MVSQGVGSNSGKLFSGQNVPGGHMQSTSDKVTDAAERLLWCQWYPQSTTPRAGEPANTAEVDNKW